MKPFRHILLLIVISQFAGTSLWFAGNAVMQKLVPEFGLSADVLQHITSAVQLGFITGTLTFAVFTIADRFSPSKVFFICAIAGAVSNLGILAATGLTGILVSRFITGFFLAGIYPVGMKIAADYHEAGLVKALGYLVGALVLGTAFPHLLNGLSADYNWHSVIIVVSIIAALGGLLILLLVPDGPYRKKGLNTDLRIAFTIFNNKQFRSAAFGYFGHMWELYTFWALVPVILTAYISVHAGAIQNVSIASFVIIGIGGLACVVGGYISMKKGSAKTAFTALLISCLCCLSASLFIQLPVYVFIPFMLIWGMAVVADSPQFTTMGAQSVDATIRGSAMTLANSIGFAITVISIQTMSLLQTMFGIQYIFFFLAIGPLLGLLAMRKVVFKQAS